MSELPEGRQPLTWNNMPLADRPRGHPSTERLEIEKLRAENERLIEERLAAVERVAKLEVALRVIESHRRKCHEYDADVGDGLRDFDVDDVILMEWQARAALKEGEG